MTILLMTKVQHEQSILANIGFKSLIWIGMIEQLSRNKAERGLGKLDLSLPEFSILSHFSHANPAVKTVNSISAAMQQPQPNVSKTVKKLLRKEFLVATSDINDARSKLLTLTTTGHAAFENAVSLLSPSIELAFADWESEELAEFFAKLDKLKNWLDKNR